MAIKAPEKVGEPTILAQGFGKIFLSQEFRDPETDKTLTQFLFHHPTPPVIVFPLTAENEVIILDQFRFAANRIIIELPGGVPSKGQSREEAVRTELEEETGYQPGRLSSLTVEPIFFEPANSTVPYWPYLAQGCRLAGEPKPDEHEWLQARTVTLEKWVAMIRSQEVRDSKSIAVTLLALLRLGFIELKLP